MGDTLVINAGSNAGLQAGQRFFVRRVIPAVSVIGPTPRATIHTAGWVQILGVDIPEITIPVRPGRDLARLIEVAAFQAKLRASGYNPARELNDRLIAKMASASKI